MPIPIKPPSHPRRVIRIILVDISFRMTHTQLQYPIRDSSFLALHTAYVYILSLAQELERSMKSYTKQNEMYTYRHLHRHPNPK
jgi:hypothetical protein